MPSVRCQDEEHLLSADCLLPTATRPPIPSTCLFVPCTFPLTPQPTYGSLSSLSQESAGKRQPQGKAKGTRQGAKRRGNGKKMLFCRNEPSHLVQTKDLAF